MTEKSGGGHFVIIRTDDSWGYNDYIFDLGNVTSVSTFVITSRQGSDAHFVVDHLQRASALFIAGGDQYTYVTNWNDTEVHRTLVSLWKRGVPMGGTSAGMMVLSEFIYTCASGESTTSAVALANPYDASISIGSRFLPLPLFTTALFDTHFEQRDRMGRLVTFLARVAVEFNLTTVRGVGCDERTAILVEADGTATFVSQTQGVDHVCYFLTTTGVCECVG